MAVTLQIYIEDITVQMAAGYTTIRLYSASTPEALASGSSVDTATLVALQEVYELTHSSGTAATWYAYDLFDGVSTATGLSERFRTDATRLIDLMFEVASGLSKATGGLADAGGSTTSLIDAVLIDSGGDAHFMEGGYLYRPNAAAAADKLRRVKSAGFTTTTGALGVDRAWTNAPSAAEVYQIYGALPPVDYAGTTYSWQRAVNDGLLLCAWTDEINLGEGSSTGTHEFSLAAHLGAIGNPSRSIRNVWTATYDSNSLETRIDQSKRGRSWKILGNGPRDQKLWLATVPGTSETVLAEVTKRGERLFDDDDVTTCPYDLAIAAGRFMALRQINSISKGEDVGALANAKVAFDDARQIYAPRGVALIG